MYFRLGTFVEDLYIYNRKTRSLSFKYGGIHDIRVKLSQIKNPKNFKSEAHVIGYFKISSKIGKYLKDIYSNKLPDEMKDDENVKQEMEWYENKVELLSMKYFPKPFQDSMRNIRKILYSTLDNTVKVLRWRCNRDGSPKPFINMGMYFSQQQKKWKSVPHTMGISFTGHGITPYPSGIATNVKALVNKNYLEPLGHELLREAEQLEYRSTRSSAIVLFSALEVGMKEYISRVHPDSKWLVENMPSPPIYTMLSEYLPVLPAKNKINGKVKPPPKEIMQMIREGVDIRNRVIHRGVKGPALIELKTYFQRSKILCGFWTIIQVMNGHTITLVRRHDNLWNQVHGSIRII